MHITELIRQKKFVITCEIDSPKGVNSETFLDKVDEVKNSVHAISISDNLRAVMRCSALAMCHLLKTRDIEPIMELNTRDRNRLALQSDLLAAATFGVENIIISSGYDVSLGDHRDASPVHDLDTVFLVKAARDLNDERDFAGHGLDGPSNFCIGVLAEIGLKPDATQMDKLKRGVDAGADFFVTQAMYDTAVLEEFLDSVGQFRLPVIVGHVMLKSASSASFLNSNAPGISIPERIIKQLEGLSREALFGTSQQITVEFIESAKSLCQGVHLVPMGWERFIPHIVEAVGS